jgi:hypothetical protein
LKLVWQAKNISGGFLISGAFVADLTNSAKGVFLSGRSGGFRVSFNKNKKFKLFLVIKKIKKIINNIFFAKKIFHLSHS